MEIVNKLQGLIAKKYQMKIDLAGFCTGIVDKKDIIDGKSIKPTDRIIGLASNGVHANGFTLIRYLTNRLKLKVDEYPELLNPTRIYASVVKKLLKEGNWV